MVGTDRSDEPVEDIARLREAFASASVHARPGNDCPEPQQLWAAINGELPAWKRRELVDHTATCAACAEAWRLARELTPAPAVEAASESWTSRLASFLGLAWSGNQLALAGAAAAVVLSVAITARFMTPTPVAGPEGPAYRDPNHAQIRSLSTTGEALPRQEPLLRWSPGQEGSEYTVTVTTEDLRPVFSAQGLKAAELRIPAERLEGLPAGTRLLWQVEARLPDGTRVRSDTFIVRLQ